MAECWENKNPAHSLYQVDQKADSFHHGAINKCYEVSLGCLYSRILSSYKKNKIMPFATTWIQLEILLLNEVRKRKTNSIWYHLYAESKIWHKLTNLQNRNRLTDMENRLVVVKGDGGWRGMDWEFGVSKCKLLHLEWISNEVLLYSTGNYIQSPGIYHDGNNIYQKRKYEKNVCMYMCDWVTMLYNRNWHNSIKQLYSSKIF